MSPRSPHTRRNSGSGQSAWVAEIRPDYETEWAAIGAVAARPDNALMKSAIGLYKTELISKRSS